MPSAATSSKSSTSQQSNPQNVALVEMLTSYLTDIIHAQTHPTLPSCIEPIALLPDPKFPSFEFFCAEREPSISIKKYVERLVGYLRCSPECFVFALAYIRRAVDAGMPIHLRSVHRLILTACVVAAKTRDDHYYSMTYYSQVGGVTPADMNGMELRFLLDVIDFRAEVSVDEYRFVCSDIHHSVQTSRQRSQLLLGGVDGINSAIAPSTMPSKVYSGCSLSESENAQGLSVVCSPSSTPTGGLRFPSSKSSPAPLHLNSNDDIRKRGRLCDMHPAPQWIVECGLYW